MKKWCCMPPLLQGQGRLTLVVHFPQGKFFYVIIAVMSTPNFTYSLYFTPYNPIILNGYTSSRSIKYTDLSTKLGWRSMNDW